MRLALGVAVVGLVAGAACSGGSSIVPPERPAGYVALGDSFSAGEGADPYDPDSGACHRSEESWPHLLPEAVGGDDELQLLELRACGGARVDDLLEPWTERGQPAQIPAEPDPTVGLVTFTIGGNDIGFGQLVATCVLGSCASMPDSAGFAQSLDVLRTRLVDEVYPALRAAFPNARLVHVGYPNLTPPPGEPRGRCLWLSAAEQEAVPEIIRSLEDVGRTAAAAAQDEDAAFVSVFDALAGHELCRNELWVREVISLNPSRAHPNAKGYRAIAATVASGLAELDP